MKTFISEGFCLLSNAHNAICTVNISHFSGDIMQSLQLKDIADFKPYTLYDAGTNNSQGQGIMPILSSTSFSSVLPHTKQV